MLRFLKSTIFNGLVNLLPILLLIILFKELFGLLIGLATPIADLFPRDVIDSIPETNALAVLLIVGSALVLGMVSLIPAVASAGRYLEQRILAKIPVYLPLKTLLHALLGSDASESFKPAFIHRDSGDLEPAYIVEDTGRPRVVVLLPWTPNSFAGSLKCVPREHVFEVDLTFDEFSLSLSHFGVGLTKLLPEPPEQFQVGPDSGS